MTDRELLELAAKAAGVDKLGLYWSDTARCLLDGEMFSFDPLTDDGDALRLAVKLRLELGFPKEYCVWSFGTNGVVCMEDPSNDPYAATRRAIVKAAAEIGRGME